MAALPWKHRHRRQRGSIDAITPSVYLWRTGGGDVNLVGAQEMAVLSYRLLQFGCVARRLRSAGGLEARADV